jgi:hypothetical protein
LWSLKNIVTAVAQNQTFVAHRSLERHFDRIAIEDEGLEEDKEEEKVCNSSIRNRRRRRSGRDINVISYVCTATFWRDCNCR